jgi:hypothetical protein
MGLLDTDEEYQNAKWAAEYFDLLLSLSQGLACGNLGESKYNSRVCHNRIRPTLLRCPLK